MLFDEDKKYKVQRCLKCDKKRAVTSGLCAECFLREHKKARDKASKSKLIIGAQNAIQ